MTNVEEAKTNYLKVKKAVASCQSSIAELQRKCDTLQESLPGLTRAVEEAGKAKVSALDAFALNSNKTTEQALKVARQAYETAQKVYSEKNELIEATARALTKQQAEFLRFNNAYDLARRELWQAIAGEIKSAIPSEVFESIKKLQVIGSQCGQTRSWLLDSLFPNIPTGDFQEIRNELCEKYNIE